MHAEQVRPSDARTRVMLTRASEHGSTARLCHCSDYVLRKCKIQRVRVSDRSMFQGLIKCV